MLVVVPERHTPAGNWLYPLISGIALFIVVAAAVYVLTSVWRDRTASLLADEAPPPAPPAPAAASALASLAAAEILDRRLASGEITIEEYRKVAEVLDRRHAASPAAASTAAANGAATAAV
jgi:hypothetical protein